jgi:DNA-binding XRE family transcriptional regulator
MNQDVGNINVTEKLQVYQQANGIVTKLIQIRKDAGFSQRFMAEWLNVSRKKINEFENGKFDFDLMVQYADKISVDIELSYKIN